MTPAGRVAPRKAGRSKVIDTRARRHGIVAVVKGQETFHGTYDVPQGHRGSPFTVAERHSDLGGFSHRPAVVDPAGRLSSASQIGPRRRRRARSSASLCGPQDLLSFLVLLFRVFSFLCFFLRPLSARPSSVQGESHLGE